MIGGMIGLLLNLWLVVGLAVFVSAVFLALIHSKLLMALSYFNVHAKQSLLWCVALLPYGIGLYASILVLIPLLSHELGIALDHGHSVYPQGHFHWLGWQGVGSLVLAGALLWKFLIMLWHGLQQHRQITTLLEFAELDDRGCYSLDSDLPNAFTLGLIRPKILISRTLKNNLTIEELDVVYRHEYAHQQSRDPLRLWLFNVLLMVFIPFARRQLYNTMELLVEQQADAKVACQFNNPELVANTLIKVNRLSLRYHQQRLNINACAFCVTATEQRIRQLLVSDNGRAFPFPSFYLGAITLLLIGCYYATSLHLRIESLLHYHF